MGCVSSVVGPAPTPLTPPLTGVGVSEPGAKTEAADLAPRRLTMKHTPQVESEREKQLMTLVLEMGRTGKVELTSTVAREGSGQEVGTLTKAELSVLSLVPAVIFTMANIKELVLRCNQISTLPREIAQLKLLEVLILAENQVRELPAEITQLRKLKVLDMGENQLIRLPDGIGSLKSLEVLRANRNKLTQIPSSIKNCSRLRILNLYNNQIVQLDAAISELGELEELNASNNALLAMPSMKWWKNLKRLYLQVNKLYELPSMDALGNLEIFQAQMNALTTLPSMANLVLVKKMDLNNNQLHELPSSMEHMTMLNYLNLRKNRLIAIPPFLCYCKSLEILDLGNNPICPPVPGDLVTLLLLKTLLLDGTLITVLPIELMALRHVCRVNLGNMLQMDDQETCEVVMELRNSCAENGGWLKTG